MNRKETVTREIEVEISQDQMNDISKILGFNPGEKFEIEQQHAAGWATIYFGGNEFASRRLIVRQKIITHE